MTNIVAAVVIVVSTNWTYVGSFQPASGYREDVKNGNYVTNVYARFEWKGQDKDTLLETHSGPFCCQARFPFVNAQLPDGSTPNPMPVLLPPPLPR